MVLHQSIPIQEYHDLSLGENTPKKSQSFLWGPRVNNILAAFALWTVIYIFWIMTKWLWVNLLHYWNFFVLMIYEYPSPHKFHWCFGHPGGQKKWQTLPCLTLNQLINMQLAYYVLHSKTVIRIYDIFY